MGRQVNSINLIKGLIVTFKSTTWLRSMFNTFGKDFINTIVTLWSCILNFSTLYVKENMFNHITFENSWELIVVHTIVFGKLDATQTLGIAALAPRIVRLLALGQTRYSLWRNLNVMCHSTMSKIIGELYIKLPSLSPL